MRNGLYCYPLTIGEITPLCPWFDDGATPVVGLTPGSAASGALMKRAQRA
jgi:hypothetical protein